VTGVVGVVRLRGAGVVVVVDAGFVTGLVAGLVAGLLAGRPVLPPIMPPPVTPLGSCWASATLLHAMSTIADRLINRGRDGINITFSPAACSEWTRRETTRGHYS